jgi:hypothetical protein
MVLLNATNDPPTQEVCKVNYIPAKNVLSPKGSFHLVRVLSDPGPSTDDAGKVSYACGFWEGRPVIVTRWNGSDEFPIGNPQSRGLPVWFVIDDNLYPFLVPFFEKIAPGHVEFLRGFLALKQAA